jgi:monoamine oxidase
MEWSCSQSIGGQVTLTVSAATVIGRSGQYTRFAGVEREPQEGVHFCGEHTSIDAQGYLEGAVETGERAADEIISALR